MTSPAASLSCFCCYFYLCFCLCWSNQLQQNSSCYQRGDQVLVKINEKAPFDVVLFGYMTCLDLSMALLNVWPQPSQKVQILFPILIIPSGHDKTSLVTFGFSLQRCRASHLSVAKTSRESWNILVEIYATPSRSRLLPLCERLSKYQRSCSIQEYISTWCQSGSW